MGIGEDTVGAAYMVIDHFRLLFEEVSPGILFMLNDLRQDLLKALHNGAFGFTERHLIGHLKDVSEGFGAFPVEATDSQTKLVDGLDNGIDLLGQDQAGQMEHSADPDARTYIGRAGSEVTPFRAEGEFELLFELRIGLIDGGPGLFELEARAKSLHPEMVLLVDHYAKGFFSIQDQAAAGALGGVLAADEMPFDKDLLIERRKTVHAVRERVFHVAEALDGGTDHVEHADAFRLFGPARESGFLEVAGETDAAGHHYAVMRPLALRDLSRSDQE